MKQSLVSIIIVNWNGGKVFKACLQSLSKIDYPNWELIVVDNGSTDGSDNYPNTKKIIKNKNNIGFAPANNQGVKKAKGKYVLLLNNDTKITKDFLTKLVKRAEEDKSIGVLQPKMFMMDKKGYLDNAGSYMTRLGFLEHWGFGQKDSKEFEKETEVFSAKGACMLIRKEVIEKVGLFDKDFVSYFEESDFCWRVWLAGYKVLFYPEASIEHKVGFTIKRLDVANINYDYYKNRIASIIKNAGAFSLLTILPVHIAASIGIATVFFFRGSSKNASMILSAIWWNIVNISKTLNKRRKIQKLRKKSDKEIFRKLMRPVDIPKFYEDFKRVEKDIG